MTEPREKNPSKVVYGRRSGRGNNPNRIKRTVSTQAEHAAAHALARWVVRDEAGDVLVRGYSKAALIIWLASSKLKGVLAYE